MLENLTENFVRKSSANYRQPVNKLPQGRCSYGYVDAHLYIISADSCLLKTPQIVKLLQVALK